MLPTPPRILTCARIHRQNASTHPIDLTLLARLLHASPTYSAGLAIATDGDDPDLVRAVEALIRVEPARQGFEVLIIPVSPYGRFVTPLNAMIARAAKDGYERMLFQSLEVVVGRAEIEALAGMMDEDTLVVGKAFDSHAFVLGMNKLTGLTTPWNTCALWDVKKIALTGFLLVADGLDPEVVPATEVCPISPKRCPYSPLCANNFRHRLAPALAPHNFQSCSRAYIAARRGGRVGGPLISVPSL
ncbi:hypothetical protein BC936DRAFT_148125 [Jimgerdemannia flammicorona]|uniref:Uncharacterized protein n=1 Tax=Jimgerdemannia flammicorona TaxID=994334 RepID=A0A433DKQ0_9FUNG|nr:hypothetical protein BC936DRAFT_148125 [Jimgerdemannia flammicorona]